MHRIIPWLWAVIKILFVCPHTYMYLPKKEVVDSNVFIEFLKKKFFLCIYRNLDS